MSYSVHEYFDSAHGREIGQANTFNDAREIAEEYLDTPNTNPKTGRPVSFCMVYGAGTSTLINKSSLPKYVLMIREDSDGNYLPSIHGTLGTVTSYAGQMQLVSGQSGFFQKIK